MEDELSYYDDDYDENDENSNDNDKTISDYDVESAGFMDGESDVNFGMPKYGSYGSSLDLGSLTDAQRDLYDNAYHSGQDVATDWDDLDS